MNKKPRNCIDLPAEIRDRIYKLVLVLPPPSPSEYQSILTADQTKLWCQEDRYGRRLPGSINRGLDRISIFLSQPYPWYSNQEMPHPRYLSLLLTSKQIYIEALHISYRFNQLEFYSTDVLGRFLEKSSNAYHSQTTNIVFLWKWHQP